MDIGLTGWKANWRSLGAKNWDLDEAGPFVGRADNIFEPPLDLLRGAHDVRIQIFSPTRFNCASLFVDGFRTERDPHTQFLSVIWPHSAGDSDLWGAARDFVLFVSGARLASGPVHFLWNDQRSPVERKVDIEALPPHLEGCDRLVGVFAKAGKFEFVAQAGRPLGDYRAAMVWPIMGETDETFLHAVSELILRNPERRLAQMHPEELTRVLHRCASHLSGRTS